MPAPLGMKIRCGHFQGNVCAAGNTRFKIPTHGPNALETLAEILPGRGESRISSMRLPGAVSQLWIITSHNGLDNHFFSWKLIDVWQIPAPSIWRMSRESCPRRPAW
jgi:hypothetical protein